LRENRIYLGEAGTDGQRSLHIDWDLGRNAVRVATAVQSTFARFWAANGLERVARLELLDFTPDAAIAPTNLYDIYHPAGTTRMSLDSNTGVVDSNLLVHGTSNAFVAGSAVFPSLGAANPTFTAMALGLRLADFIDRELTAP
jgi:choline dehydrogenase-like flavoprotein